MSNTDKPLLELDTPEQKQKALLAFFGILIVLSTAFIGAWLFAALVSPSIALLGGFSCVMFVGGCLGYATVLVRQAVQQVNIKVVKEE